MKYIKWLITFSIVVGIAAYVYDDHFSDRARAQRSLLTGAEKVSKGNFEAAIPDLSEAAKLNPARWEAFFLRGIAHHVQKRLAEAIKDYELGYQTWRIHRSRNVDRRILESFRIYELLLLSADARTEMGDLDGALADYDKSIRIDFGRLASFSHVARARLRLAKGDADGALAALDATIKEFPNNAGAYLERGAIKLFHRGDAAAAFPDLSTAMTRAVEFSEMSKVLDAANRSQIFFSQDSVARLASYHAFVPDGYYLAAWLHIARVRNGQPGTKELVETVEKISAPLALKLWLSRGGQRRIVTEEANRQVLATWPGPVIELFLGTLSPAQLRERSTEVASPEERQERACDADFYIGLFELAKGAKEVARSLLESAANRCPKRKREAAAAVMELKRLE